MTVGIYIYIVTIVQHEWRIESITRNKPCFEVVDLHLEENYRVRSKAHEILINDLLDVLNAIFKIHKVSLMAGHGVLVALAVQLLLILHNIVYNYIYTII